MGTVRRRAYRVGNRLRLTRVYGEEAADGQEQHVGAAYLFKLPFVEPVAEVAEVDDADALGGDDVDEVLPALRALGLVVEALERAGPHTRRACP